MAQISAGISPNVQPTGQSRYTFQIAIIGVLFFFFGFVTNTNDILIPHLKKACQLTDFQSAFVQFAFFGAYFVMSLPSGYLIQRLGYRKSIVTGLLVCAAGALLFIPAAETRFYLYFLFALGVLASGVTILQNAANPYVSVLGPMETAPVRVNIMGVCNKTAGFLAPLIFGALFLAGTDYTTEQINNMPEAARNALLDAEAAKVVGPYLLLAGVLAAVALLIYFSRLPEIREESSQSGMEVSVKATSSVWQHRNLLFGVGAIFFYVATEVGVGSFIIRYGQSLNIPGFTDEYGSTFVSAYWLLTGIASFVGIFIVGKYVKSHVALTFNAVLAVGLILLAMVTSGMVSLLAIVAIGLCHSIMWPVIFPMAITGLGRFTKIGSSFLIMAIAGGAVFPLFMGFLSDAYGIKIAYLSTLICYAYLIFYGISGYKPVLTGKLTE